MPSLPELITEAQSTEERFLRQIFVRDQMAEWTKHPLIMARAEGVHYWDVSGKRYLDGLSGIYVAALGHGNRRVIDAIRAQMDVLCFSPPMHGTNALAVQLANLLAELAPGDLSAVKFQCGGSEVTEASIKLARQYHRLTGNPGKYKVISRYLSWHGSTLGSLSASGLKGRKTVNEAARPRLPSRIPAHLLPLPVRKDLSRLRRHVRLDRRRRDRDGRPGHGRRDHGGADRAYRRTDRPPARVPPDPPRGLRPPQRPADLRRDHHRDRPDGEHVRGRDVRGDARRVMRRERAGGRLRPDLGDDLR